ncbi:ABC transporter permease [Pseudonocardia phyllosphaerae]|uniref:ABC transporter permease n=1 Tax=Pseudonocardia phyllosphaerae TaxID=3390502 RepID=UPI00397C47D2
MTTFAEGTFTPAPGRGSLVGMLRAQAGLETRLALRNAEQVLLTLLIPAVLLVVLALVNVLPTPEPRVSWVFASMLALAVMSSAFTSQAIALGFDRRYGALRRLGATAIPRWLLVCGRLTAVGVVVVIQVVLLALLALLLGWSPAGARLDGVVLAVLLGAAAFGALGILLGGTLRAEITLAVANLVWFLLLLAGGIVVPVAELPGPLSALAGWLPSGALAEALRAALGAGQFPPAGSLLVLAGWAVAAGLLAARTVRWR